MAKFSIGLAQDLMVYRLISNVRVKRKRSGFATCAYKGHHGIISDLLAIKMWDRNRQGKAQPPIYNPG